MDDFNDDLIGNNENDKSQNFEAIPRSLSHDSVRNISSPSHTPRRYSRRLSVSSNTGGRSIRANSQAAHGGFERKMSVFDDASSDGATTN